MSGRILCPTLVAGLVAAFGLPATARGATCADGDLESSADNEPAVARALMCEMNARRAQQQLAPLRRNVRLDRSARYHADDMAFFRYFAHQRPNGPSVLTRIRATGYFDHVVGGMYTENLADAPSGRASAAAVVDAWMQSEYHRRNLLVGAFRDAGVAIEIVPADPAFYPDRPSVLFAVDYGRRYYRSRRACRRRSAGDKRTATRPRHLCPRRKHGSRRS